MKRSLALFVPALALSAQVLASPPVIYGEDGRMEVYQASPMQQKLAQSAASMIPVKEISPGVQPGMSLLSQRTLAQMMTGGAPGAPTPAMSKILKENADQAVGFCKSERFVNQPTPGMCSGFLIAPDLLVTAGHCVAIENFCEGHKWVFDFKVDEATGEAGKDVKNENIYSCKRVLSGALEMNLSSDFGLIQLDRDVVGREPLKIQDGRFITPGTDLVVIGGPSGLPLKVTVGGKVRSSAHPFFFTATLDTFQGNSGSAVFNAETGVVEGILVRGEEDFELNQERMCIQAKQCKETECRGEDVSRMTSMPEVAAREFLLDAIVSGNSELLDQVFALGTWVDFYQADKVTALMVAAKHGRTEALTKLILRAADVSLKDVEGNTALHHLAETLTAENELGLKVLLLSGADLEARNLEGRTPLLTAALAMNLDGVKALIRAGADKTVVDADGRSILSAFEAAGDLAAVKEIASMGAVPHPVE